ncbi:MAG: sigma-70 family RNA polymerase sigma factor [Bacteroidota bacterium]|nr:sigma-70 family RNA polymerase sigma factor [Bacteroidota bacterium]
MEPGKKFSNNELIKGVKIGNRIVLEYLYDATLEQFKNFVSYYGGQSDDAFEFFQDVMAGIYRRLKENDLHIEKSLEAYILVSCKKQYIKYKTGNKGRIFIPIDDHLDMEKTTRECEEDVLKEKYKILWGCLKDLSERCRKIIIMFYSGYSSGQIAVGVGLKTPSYVRRIKVDCMKKLKSWYFKRY